MNNTPKSPTKVTLNRLVNYYHAGDIPPLCKSKEFNNFKTKIQYIHIYYISVSVCVVDCLLKQYFSWLLLRQIDSHFESRSFRCSVRSTELRV